MFNTEMEKGCYVVEWKIENFSQWCAEVHGECIKSPELYRTLSYIYCCDNIELYPKGISGLEEHLVVRFYGLLSYSGDLCFYCPNGTLLCPKKSFTKAAGESTVLPPGPKFEDLLSRIRQEGEDFIIVRLRIQRSNHFDERRLCTTISVLKISLKINPRWIEKNSDETAEVFSIQLSPNDDLAKIHLKTWSKYDTLHFTIMPPTEYDEYPFAIEMFLRLRGSDGSVESRERKEHVFSDTSPWTFFDALQKKELDEKEISLFLYLKTRNFIKGPFHMSSAHSCVSIDPDNTLCFSEIEPTTSSKDSLAVVTKDSESQTSVTSDMPDDSLLSTDLMCLYQDQEFSDIELKCDSVSFPVHRAILSARSPVFKTMLSTDMTEAASNEVDIGDLDPSTLGLFLTYLYTGAVEDLSCDRALNLYYAADKYQVPSLKGECAKLLCSDVSISNVCDILSLADRHRDDKLISAAHDFILSNYNDVLKSKEWESFMCREPLLAVKTLTHFAAKDSVRKHDPE